MAKIFTQCGTPPMTSKQQTSTTSSTVTYTSTTDRKLTKKERKAQRRALKPMNENNSRSQATGLSTRRAEFLRMVATARPDGTATEAAFIERWIDPLALAHDSDRDFMGNIFITVGKPRIAFTAHTDTVHWREGWQSITYDRATGIIRLAENSAATCLGADCTAGLWLMRQMILAEREGLYCFYRAEESGCLGSAWSASHEPERYRDIDAMISLDRRGFDSVVTHQCMRRTCSDAFARSLARELNGIGLAAGGGDLGTYKPDDGGLFTDSREFISVIGECTNISVGYFDQHSKKERQHLLHLDHLLGRLIALDTSKLALSRQPGDTDYEDFDSDLKYHRTKTYEGYWADYTFADNTDENDEGHVRDLGGSALMRLETLVKAYPDVAALIINAYGVSPEDFRDEVYRELGIKVSA